MPCVFFVGFTLMHVNATPITMTKIPRRFGFVTQSHSMEYIRKTLDYFRLRIFLKVKIAMFYCSCSDLDFFEYPFVSTFMQHIIKLLSQ